MLLLLLLHGGREICQRITVNNWHLTKDLSLQLTRGVKGVQVSAE
jgi:hypothetical protein